MARHIALVGFVALVVLQGVVAHDPTITTDCGLVGATSGDDFTSTAFNSANLPPNPPAGGLVLAPQFAAQFPGVTGLGISSLFFKLGAGGLVPLHFHARATEIFFVLLLSFTQFTPNPCEVTQSTVSPSLVVYCVAVPRFHTVYLQSFSVYCVEMNGR